MINNMESIVDMILDDRLDEAREELLMENVEEKLLKSVAEVSYANYLMKFEAYFNDHDGYMFGQEWDNAQILLDKIKVDKFWVNIYMIVAKGTDLRGAKRLLTNGSQNKISYKKLSDGSVLLKFRILKRYLDKMEIEDKSKAQEIATREMPTSPTS